MKMKHQRLVCLVCGVLCTVVSGPAAADAEYGAWVGEPRIEMKMAFGGARADSTPNRGFSIAFGLGSRFLKPPAESGSSDLILPVTGLMFSSRTGIFPVLLGHVPESHLALNADEEKPSFSWQWVLGAVAAGAAAIALADSGGSPASDGSATNNGGQQTANSNGATVNGVGPSDGDGECDVASNDGGTITVIEDECTSPSS